MRKWMAGVLLGVACCGMAAAQEIPNPLKRALRGLFGKPQVQTEEELTHRNRRTEDRRAPYSVEQAELFERGDQRWKQGDYGGAFPIFQQVLEGGEDCLVPVGVGQKVVWRSVRDEIEERLRGAGGEVEQSYRELYGGVAERLLQAGDEGEGSARWAEVAVRYFATSSGQEGADRLASWHLDRGEIAAAGRWLKRLSAAKSRLCESTAWKLKAIWVARQLGDQKWGEELVASLEGVDEGELVLGGRKVGLEELKSGKILTGIDRSGDDHRKVGMGEPTLYQRWSGKLCESEQLAGLIKRNYVSRGERQLSTRCAFEPLVVGDKVVTRGWRGVEVRDRLSGQLLWRGADRHPPEAIFTDMFKGSSTDGERLMRMDSMFFPAISQMFGHEEEVATDFLLAGMWLFYDRNGGIVSSDGSRLFVVDEQPLLVEGMYGGPFG
ncbi:MAG: hypothetical protein KDA36_01295, partial [Planctomycetaceae bacterium]|nr:hypothetical protein [Planctomycetaceae bacterium]